MRGAAQQDKDMPYRVVIGDFPAGVKKNAEGVKETSEHEPEKQPRRQEFEHGFDGDDRQSAHHDVYSDGNIRISADKGDFKNQAEDRHATDQAEQGPPPRTAHGDQ